MPINVQKKLPAATILAAGLFFLFYAKDLAPGTLADMGPGFLPRVMSILLIIIGVILAFSAQEEFEETLKLRPTLTFTLAPILFGFAYAWLGLAAAIITTVIAVSAFANGRVTYVTGLIAVSLAAFCCLVFVYGIGQPLEIWP